MTYQQVALVTGSNRGIGFEIAKQLAKAGVKVILSARTLAKLQATQQLLESEGLQTDGIELDVANRNSIQKAAEHIEARYGHLDFLVNNAGILPDADSEASGLTVAADTVREVFETNTLGPLQVSQVMAPLLRKGKNAKILNISSGMGALNDMDGGYASYRISKTALNAVTRILASELERDDILVYSICPGWVRTEMGGAQAERTPAQSVAGILPVLLAEKPQPSGSFLRDGKPIAW